MNHMIFWDLFAYACYIIYNKWNYVTYLERKKYFIQIGFKIICSKQDTSNLKHSLRCVSALIRNIFPWPQGGANELWM